MNKPKVTDEMVDAFLSAIDKIDPFGRGELNMTPQQYRRYRVGTALKAAMEVKHDQAK